MNHFRKLKNRPRPVQEEKDLVLFEQIADDTDIVRESESKLERRLVARALSELKVEYRDVLILRVFEEKSYEEISDILEIPKGTVATYIARGKAELRELLKKHAGTDV